MGKASASEARSSGFEPPWLAQRSRWESRPLSLVGNGAGAVTHPTDWAGSVFPRGTGRFLVQRVSISHPFAVSAKQHSVVRSGQVRKQLGKERARRSAPMLREAGALVPECHADASEDSVVSRRDGVTESGAAEHHMGCRFRRGAAVAGAVLLLAPFDKPGHLRELPSPRQSFKPRPVSLRTHGRGVDSCHIQICQSRDSGRHGLPTSNVPLQKKKGKKVQGDRSQRTTIKRLTEL